MTVRANKLTRVGGIAALLMLAAACSNSSKNGAASSACISDKDCRSQGKLCNPATAACVQCLQASDCGMNADCVAGACVPFVTCKSSLECKSSEVCDTSRGRCVACLADADCGMAMLCVANTCHPTCQSDKDCVSMHQLCDFTTTTCVDCIRDADCATGKFCNAGACSDQVCSPGSTSCTANMLFMCSANGTAWQNPTTCPDVCSMTADGGVCTSASSGGGGMGGSQQGGGGGSTQDASGPDTFVGPCGDMIDDMEDGDGYICRGNGRIGQWYTAGSTLVTPDQNTHPIPPAIISPPRGTSNYAMRMQAPAGYGYGGILGVDLQYDGTTVYGSYNASVYLGITFWARGMVTDSVTMTNAIDVWVACAQTTPTTYGGTCSLGTACYDNFSRVYIGTDWTQISVPFSSLASGYAPFDKSQVTHIQFRIVGSPTTAVDLWVDDLALYR
jgi:hypothetical protein